MEFLIANITEDELFILEHEGFNWYPAEEYNGVIIKGDIEYFNMALHAIRRLVNL